VAAGLDAIGGTPVVRLSALVGPDDAEVWVKLESANPTGSYKDRMAYAMVRRAEERGTLKPGQRVVEYTGGSTGSSLSFVCALTGHPLSIVTSDAFAEEKLRTMAAFGAELEVIQSPDGITPDLIPRMRARAAEIAQETGAYATDQFNNTDMVEGYRSMGEEMVEQVPGPVDVFTCYVGTAGCFLGATGALRAAHPDMRRIAVEPAESAVLSGRPAGTHRIEGGGSGFWPPLLHADDIDGVMTVSTDEAFATARRAAREEGIWSGPSFGASLTAALRLAREVGPGGRVVTIQCDSGLKYLNGPLYSESS
jgi:cysteine synthase